MQKSIDVQSHLDKESGFRILTTLSTIFVTLSVVSVAVGYKLVELGNYFLLSGAAFILPFRYLLGDILTEVYGYRIAIKQLVNLVICCLLFSLLATIVINLPSPTNWKYEPDFQYVLGGSLKITVTALVAMLVGVYLNILIYTKMKMILKINSFCVKALVASSAGELVQYAIVLSVLYYSQLSWQRLIGLISSDFLFQLICISILAPISQFVMLSVKRIEGVNKNINFNPFQSDESNLVSRLKAEDSR